MASKHGSGPNRESARSHALRPMWTSMMNRCYLPSQKSYTSYGGRGIAVCARWRDFWVFVADVSPRPSKGHTLDRIDNDGNYEHGNCRWATRTEQLRNQRRNRLLTHNGRTQCLTAWAEEAGLDKAVLRGRIVKLGWSVDRAITTPTRRHYRAALAAA